MCLKNKRIITIIIIVTIIIGSIFLLKDNLLKIIYPKTYNEIISIYGEKYQVEENLIFAVIKAESNFDKNAVSNRNAIGLMQVMESTAKEVANKHKINIQAEDMKGQLTDVYKNIEIGTCYLSSLIQKYGNKEVALAAYNAGTGTVDGWIEKGVILKDGSNIENIPYKETNNYVRKILRDYKIYEDLYKN